MSATTLDAAEWVRLAFLASMKAGVLADSRDPVKGKLLGRVTAAGSAENPAAIQSVEDQAGKNDEADDPKYPAEHRFLQRRRRRFPTLALQFALFRHALARTP
jgi:hypothetical protein